MINFSGTRRSWILLKLVNLLKIFSYFERGVLTKMCYFFRIFFIFLLPERAVSSLTTVIL